MMSIRNQCQPVLSFRRPKAQCGFPPSIQSTLDLDGKCSKRWFSLIRYFFPEPPNRLKPKAAENQWICHLHLRWCGPMAPISLARYEEIFIPNRFDACYYMLLYFTNMDTNTSQLYQDLHRLVDRTPMFSENSIIFEGLNHAKYGKILTFSCVPNQCLPWFTQSTCRFYSDSMKSLEWKRSPIFCLLKEPLLNLAKWCGVLIRSSWSNRPKGVKKSAEFPHPTGSRRRPWLLEWTDRETQLKQNKWSGYLGI